MGVSFGALALNIFYSKDLNPPDIEPEIIGLEKFSKKGDCIYDKKELEILQVVESNMAIANSGDITDDLLVLLINYEDKKYYDHQKIKIPSNKCGKQIGIYKYVTRIGLERTIPAILIE